MNRTIWMFWRQGADRMPPLVEQCVRSWTELNPGWQVRLVDGSSTSHDLPDFTFPFPPQSMPPSLAADLFRLNVLARHGGVWADATVLCRKPLDAWLEPYLASGFFAFSRPGPDRMLSTWFLAADRAEHPVLVRWAEATNHYWSSGPRRPIGTGTPAAIAVRIARLGPWLVANRFCSETLRIYPYFWLQYIFEGTCSKYPEVAAIWDETPRIPAAIPHKLRREGLQSKVNPRFVQAWNRSEAPVFKLSHRTSYPSSGRDRIVDFALDERNWHSVR